MRVGVKVVGGVIVTTIVVVVAAPVAAVAVPVYVTYRLVRPIKRAVGSVG